MAAKALTPVRRLGMRWAAALGLMLCAFTASAAELCQPSAPLYLVGMDTRGGAVLWNLPATSQEPGRLVEMDADGDTVRSHAGAQAETRRFGGSLGPGPVFALRPCGDGCVQPEVWDEGRWQPLGDALTLPVTGVLTTTYDRGGTPWIVHTAPASGGSDTRAYRLQAGTWRSRGRLTVFAAGSPAALPAPGREDAIVSGSGLFSAGAAPRHWLTGLPALDSGGGQVLPLGEAGAVFLAEGGQVSVSEDGGNRWKRLRWQPWGVTRTDLWNHGSEYNTDLALGGLAAPLPVAWFDLRPGRERQITVSELSTAGEWTRLAELPLTLEAASGESLEVADLLRTDGGTWLMVAGCFAGDDGALPTLGLRIYSPAGLSKPRFLPIVPARR